MKCVKYTTETKIITVNGQVDSNCNSIIFLNTGTNNVFIDGIRVTPGTSINIAGNFGEMLIKAYSIKFTGGNQSLTIIYKRYLPE